MNRIIYYYQTFTGLQPILSSTAPPTHIYISSIHFGKNDTGNSYIHLNDYSPDNSKFDNVWNECQIASEREITIMFMLGGAGGAYGELFSNFETCYQMLKNTIKKRPYIKGIDLDVEEDVSLSNIKMLINRINTDFGSDFIITMAPLGSSLINDFPGLGNFVYKDLYNSSEGQRINWFNSQCYFTYTPDVFTAIVDNGYPEEKIVFGMISSEFSRSLFNNALKSIKKIKQQYNKFGGVFVWEYCNAPPKGSKDPSEWAKEISQVLN